MSHFRYLTAGESHGKCLTAIIEGLPSGLLIDVDFINKELKRRQQGYGRGSRQKIEADTVEITSGVRFGKTLGTPLTLVIQNKDYDNWQKIMSILPSDETDEKSFSSPRPGHADFAGSIKYNQKDLRNILERSSARKTAIEVAVGAVAKLFLKEFGITGSSKILQIKDGKNEEEFHTAIDNAKKNGDTVGGKFEIVFENLPIGLGSFVQADRCLDGKIAQCVMSIPAIKAVSFGEGENAYKLFGSEFHDEIFVKDEKFYHKTNNAGGIEGGMTNGEKLVVKAVMKPIPTLLKPLKTVDLKTLKETEAHFERSDTCAVESCAVVAEARIACVLANEILDKFGGDFLEEIKINYKK
ncbi:MAG: chorismate synthase [Clostridiaceae bacterium]|nr:chorismate synthase [Clostridiaceae bacterium]